MKQVHHAGVLAQSAATRAASTLAGRRAHKMAQPVTQTADTKIKEAIEERIPSSSESSQSESETASSWSSSEGEPHILCRYCVGAVQHNSSQPLECGSCGMQFHFNCYNAHLPCGRIHLPIEAEEVQHLPYAVQGSAGRRARGNERHLTRIRIIDL